MEKHTTTAPGLSTRPNRNSILPEAKCPVVGGPRRTHSGRGPDKCGLVAESTELA